MGNCHHHYHCQFIYRIWVSFVVKEQIFNVIPSSFGFVGRNIRRNIVMLLLVLVMLLLIIMKINKYIVNLFTRKVNYWSKKNQQKQKKKEKKKEKKKKKEMIGRCYQWKKHDPNPSFQTITKKNSKDDDDDDDDYDELLEQADL